MNSFEILAQPVRFRIVEILASGEHLSGDIERVVTREFGIGRSAVQHHLSALRTEGWVNVRAFPPEHFYGLRDDVVPQLEREIAELRHKWDRRIGAGADPLAWVPRHTTQKLSIRGWRGHGRDPDARWDHHDSRPPT